MEVAVLEFEEIKLYCGSCCVKPSLASAAVRFKSDAIIRCSLKDIVSSRTGNYRRHRPNDFARIFVLWP